MITTGNVISKDGVAFTVKIYASNEAQSLAALGAEVRFAATKTAAELDKFGPEYQRAGDITAEEFVCELNVPRIAGPLERRATFTLIKGGKS